MTRCFALSACIVALALTAADAQAATKRCLRGGAQLLAASGKARIVSVRENTRGDETRRERILGCWAATGRRFTMFVSTDIRDDSVQRETFEIVRGRYGGAILVFTTGVWQGRSAVTWDLRTGRRIHDTSRCDNVDDGSFGGISEVVFLPYGGLAYLCGQLRVADRHGDRQLEPPGTDMRQLAVSRGYGNARLYWLVQTEAGTFAKSLHLGT